MLLFTAHIQLVTSYLSFFIHPATFLLLARYVPNVAKEEYMRSV